MEHGSENKGRQVRRLPTDQLSHNKDGEKRADLGEEGEEARGVGGKVRTPSRRCCGRRSATNLWGHPCGHRIQEGDRDPCLFD